MPLKEKILISIKYFAIGGALVSSLCILTKTILLIRMNSQQCIPEENLWNYFDMNANLLRIPFFCVAGIISVLIESVSHKLPTIKIPTLNRKVQIFIEGFLFTFAVVIVITAFIITIWALFIDNPCN